MKKKIFTSLLLFVAFMGLKAQVTPYIGEIRMFAGNYAPDGWAICNGQLLSISANSALFSVIGTNYGGNGTTTFALPDLRGRAPIHQGNGHTLGQQGGTEQVTLTSTQIPSHTHTAILALPVYAGVGNADTPIGNVPAVNVARANEFNTTSNGSMGTVDYTASSATTPVGSSQPHDNMKPYMVINYIIAVQGLYPSSN
jgi:microcystin-dependent protein